jgi:hypothetical protein
MELDFDWSDSSTEIREIIDEVFAKSTQCARSDNASCGWFKIKGDKETLAEELRYFAATLEDAAYSLENQD